MLVRPLIAFCCVTLISKEVFGDGENEVKRGAFPFMAIIYYSDETVLDSFGTRFLRGGVLIRPDWLISSAIDHATVDGGPLGFPRKTLLARLGAITIENNLMFNEDEDEQEREIIQIARPTIHNVEMWWFTDITLLKTLIPFNVTSAVSPHAINPKRDYTDKSCFILVYARRFGNSTDDKVLTQLTVEMLPPSMDNCGNQFSESTMTCALDSEETKAALSDSEFCHGNDGAPLICDGDVMGLQTYIDNSCKTPHLYQLLTSWENLINCAIMDKCAEEYCYNICAVTSKDMLQGEYNNVTTQDADIMKLADSETTVQSQFETTTMTTATTESETTASSEMSSVESETTSVEAKLTSPLETVTEEETEVTSTTVVTTVTVATSPERTKASTSAPTTTTTSTTQTTTTTTASTTVSSSNPTPSTTSPDIVLHPWAADHVETRKVDEEDANDIRRPNVEAQQQQQEPVTEKDTMTARSAADMNMCFVQMLLSSLVLKCVI